MNKLYALITGFSRKIALRLHIFNQLFYFSKAIIFKTKARLLTFLIIKLMIFVIGLVVVYLSKPLLDQALLKTNFKLFVGYTILGGVLFIGGAVFEMFAAVLLQGLKNGFSSAVHERIAEKFYGADLIVMKKSSSGSNTFLADYDANTIIQFVFEELGSFLSVPKALVFISLAFYFSWQLSLIAICFVPLFLFQAIMFGNKKKDLRNKVFLSQMSLISYFQESFFNLKLVRIFAKERFALAKYMGLLGDKIKAEFDYFIFNSRNSFLDMILSRGGIVVFCLAGGYLIVSGRLSFGTFGLVSIYLSLMFSELSLMSNAFQSVTEDMAVLDSAVGLLKPELGLKNLSDPFAEFIKGKVEFLDVWFGYSDKNLVIKGISFDVEDGKWTGISGESGSGKTTVINLLLRLIEPSKGKILINGVNIQDIKKDSLRKEISLAPQEALLFNDTIFNNIAFGNDSAALDSVVMAAQAACIHEHILSLPQGFDTVVGEGGFYLSEGQKQRISIARALIRNSRMLILDEATSSIDIDTERKIFFNIKERFPDVAVILVSHRPQSLLFADRVITISLGKAFDRD
jgi:ABC-type multidrug transport system fused ATPase/permease subunit